MKIRTIIRLFFVLLSCWVGTVCSVAQRQSAEKVIDWNMAIESAGNNNIIVKLTAVINPGWHLYGTDLPKGGPVSTTFDFSASKGIEATGDIVPLRDPLKLTDPIFDVELTWWDKDISFTIPFQITDPRLATVSCVVKYMACNDETCMPPTKLTLTEHIKM